MAWINFGLIKQIPLLVKRRGIRDLCPPFHFRSRNLITSKLQKHPLDWQLHCMPINLGFVSPCIIIYSNKSTNQMNQSLSFIACSLNTAQHVSGNHILIITSLSTAVAASGLPLERGGSSVAGRGRSGPDQPRPTTLLPSRSNGKPEAATAVDRLLMMGMWMPETCWAVFKRQAIKLIDWCIWLVDLFECMPIVAEEIRADFILNRLRDMIWQWHGNIQNHCLPS
jgi:hypothetical protein